jgi:Flp pilus assembly protein TadD
MDGAIWKLRDGRIARLLLAPEPAKGTSAPAARPAEAPGASKPWRMPAWGIAALLALALEGTDLFYRFGILQANEISRTGDLNRAIQLYGSVWNWNPRTSEALNGLAFWDLRLGRLDDAVARWEKSIELNPTETSAYAHIGLGEALLRLGRVDDAMRHLERAIELRPDEPSSYILLARVYESRGDGAKAQALRVRASEVVPGVAQQRVFY